MDGIKQQHVEQVGVHLDHRLGKRRAHGRRAESAPGFTIGALQQVVGRQDFQKPADGCPGLIFADVKAADDPAEDGRVGRGLLDRFPDAGAGPAGAEIMTGSHVVHDDRFALDGFADHQGAIDHNDAAQVYHWPRQLSLIAKLYNGRGAAQ